MLVFAAHPDDAELSCGGTILKHVALGKKIGIVDLTRGELATRGTPEKRTKEAHAASRILGTKIRVNLEMRDGFIQNDEAHQLKIIYTLRKFQPDIVLANAVKDRHPDHGKAAALVHDACFLSGLRKIKIRDDGKLLNAWRPRALYHYIQDTWTDPDVLVDVSDFFRKKMKVIREFRSQFHDPDSREPRTYISTPQFLEFLEVRARDLGQMIGVKYAEGFVSERKVGVGDLFGLK